MSTMTALGAKYEIYAGEPATHDAAGFAALTPYIPVGEVSNLGDFGPSFEDVTFTALFTGITTHKKGGADYGELAMAVGFDEDDPGQSEILSGVDGANRDVVFSHKVTLQSGAIIYCTGQFFAAPFSIGDASSTVLNNVNVKLNNSLVLVAAP